MLRHLTASNKKSEYLLIEEKICWGKNEVINRTNLYRRCFRFGISLLESVIQNKNKFNENTKF